MAARHDHNVSSYKHSKLQYDKCIAVSSYMYSKVQYDKCIANLVRAVSESNPT